MFSFTISLRNIYPKNAALVLQRYNEIQYRQINFNKIQDKIFKHLIMTEKNL